MPDNITTLDGLMALNNQLEAAKAAHTISVKEVTQAQNRVAKKLAAVKLAQDAYDKARAEIEAAIAAQKPAGKPAK